MGGISAKYLNASSFVLVFGSVIMIPVVCHQLLFGVVVLKKLRQYWQDTLNAPRIALTQRADGVHHSLFRFVATASLCTTNDTGVLSRRERRHLVVVLFSKKCFEVAHCFAFVVHEQVVVQADK